MTIPQFSIIVPVYNAAQYLRPLIEQLQKQTEQDFEVIFINDCSPDDSEEILNKIASEDSRVKIFHHSENRYQGVARNTGLDNAKGTYILYIDADDSIPENYLESLRDGIVKYDADIAICNSIWVFPDREESHNIFLHDYSTKELLLSGKEALQRYFNIYKDDLWIPVEPWGRIIKRDLIEKYHLRNPDTLFEDVVMSYAELLFSQKVMLLNNYLYYYNRTNTIAATLNRQKQYIIDFPFVFEGIQNLLLKHGLFNQEKKWLTRFYFRYLWGTYEFFAKGGHFPDEMRQAVNYYKSLFPNPDIEGSEEFILHYIMAFKSEMERNNMSDVYSLFIDAHPELNNLLKIQNKFKIIPTVSSLNKWTNNLKFYMKGKK
ncbi:glycosyltransferase family 2 protein [uncultured Methanospirillum sp.]|uniref:glycosyltransferase family 2 protein n=1 Tax=uncultured Methanospirillum sp. TaxID=262503 RepID=UPI0029C6E9E9|nr:glycosyltransferase family 2 protein [uncultured Methanospirillum sp.]